MADQLCLLAFPSCPLAHAPSHLPLQSGNGFLPFSVQRQGQPRNKARLDHPFLRFTVALWLTD